MGPRRSPASFRIQLLGRPGIASGSGEVYQFRSRKSWALLTYLILAERPVSRSQLGLLLYEEADDPGRALRWNLAEIRRALGDGGSVGGDPVLLRLPEAATVDVQVVVRGSWRDAVLLPGLGAGLLEGLTVRGAGAFETWLLSQQRFVAAASEAILHEAALGSRSVGDLDRALDYAVRATAMNPLDENHQALLIRLYRLKGDDEGAERQLLACTALFRKELGVLPGPAVLAAAAASRSTGAETADEATIEARMEAGSAAVSAGALHTGVQTLREAAALADGSGATRQRVTARLALAEALIHALRGFDEEGSALLHEAAEIAATHQLPGEVARARAELGYVDFLRSRYDRAEFWLQAAAELAGGSSAILAQTSTYLGSVESDRGNYRRALLLLQEAVSRAQQAEDPRREAFALAMLGRLNLLRGDLELAAEHLNASITMAEHDHWLGFLPWPQALRGHVHLCQGELAEATQVLRQAFARACQLGDPCWEGMSARGLALVAEANGDVEAAFDLLVDARVRCNRLADPYVWLDVHILDALCELGGRYGHPGTADWVDQMRDRASRSGMRELTLRSLLHGASLGSRSDAEAATLFVVDTDAPVRTSTRELTPLA